MAVTRSRSTTSCRTTAEAPPTGLHRRAGTAVDEHGMSGGLALEPVGVELRVGPAAFAQEGLVEDLPAGERWRLGAQDLHHRVAEDLGRAPLAAVAEPPVDAGEALDDGHRPERVARDPVALVLGGDADGEPGHAHLRGHVGDVTGTRLDADGR